MKKSILKFVCLFILALLCSCEKGKDYTVKGRIVEDCAGNIPVANTEFRFRSEPKKGSFHRDGLDRTITTNANGEFEFTYNSKKLSHNGIYIVGLFEQDSYPAYATPIKSHENFELGNFAIKNGFPFKVNIQSNNTYSANDTLYILGVSQDTLLEIPGPFNNSIYGPFNYLGQGVFHFKEKDIYQYINITIKSNIIANPNYTGSGYNNKTFYIRSSVKKCDQTEQIFDIEIK